MTTVTRIYDVISGSHIYTADEAELNRLNANPSRYRNEGAAFESIGPNPVSRFVNQVTGGIFYAISPQEKESVRQNPGFLEVPGGGFAATGSPRLGVDPVYRFYNTVTGRHFFTINAEEAESVRTTLPAYRDEGVGFFADPLGDPPIPPAAQITSAPSPSLPLNPSTLVEDLVPGAIATNSGTSGTSGSSDTSGTSGTSSSGTAGGATTTGSASPTPAGFGAAPPSPAPGTFALVPPVLATGGGGSPSPSPGGGGSPSPSPMGGGGSPSPSPMGGGGSPSPSPGGGGSPSPSPMGGGGSPSPSPMGGGGSPSPSPGGGGSPSPSPGGGGLAAGAFEQGVLNLVNQARAGAGAGPLTYDPILGQVAEDHSADMLARDFFAHTNPDGTTAGTRIRNAGGQFATGRTAENIAVGYSTPEAVVNGWLNSPGHRANILNPNLTTIGIGHVFSSNDPGNVQFGHYWTQVFHG